jgi:hypothetical protein
VLRARDTEPAISSIVAETVNDDVSESERVPVAKVCALIVPPSWDMLVVWVTEAAVEVADGSKDTLGDAAPVYEEDRPSDHVAVATVALTVVKEEETVDDADSGIGPQNCIMAEMLETAPDSVTGTGVCTARATSDA